MKMKLWLKGSIRWLRCSMAPMIAIVLVASTGCGKVPTWQELMGQQPPPQPSPKAPPVSIPVEIPPIQQPVAPSAPAKPTAAEVIARFKSLPPGQVNDAALIELTSLTEGLDEITEVNASSGTVTNFGLACLKKLPALKVLLLAGTSVTNEGMQSIEQITSLESLSLHGSQFVDEGLTRLTSLPNLKSLDLGMSSVSPVGAAAIGKMPSLEALILNYVVNDSMLELICEARTLKVLNLNGSIGITDDGLLPLRKLESLEELYLSQSRVTGVGLGQVFKQGGLKNLKVLNLYHAPINDLGAKAINLLRTLESLVLADVPGMNDFGLVEIIQGMTKLKHLDISRSKGLNGQKGFAALKAANGSLETLIAIDTSVNDLALVQLKSFKKLKKLDLSVNTNCSLNGVQGLKKSLPNCEVLYAGQKY